MLYIAYLTVAKFTAASGFTHLFSGGCKRGTYAGDSGRHREPLPGGPRRHRHGQHGRVLRQSPHPGLAGAATPLQAPQQPHPQAIARRLARSAGVSRGLFASFFFVIYLPYIYGGQNLHKGPFNPEGALVAPFNRLAAKVLESDLTVFDSAKVGVCLFGALEVLLPMIGVLRNRLPWWPLHPLGLAFQNTTGPFMTGSTLSLSHLLDLGCQEPDYAHRGHWSVSPRSSFFYRPGTGPLDAVRECLLSPQTL